MFYSTISCIKIRSMTDMHIDGLVQERRNSIANALELRLSCTNPSIWPSSVLCEEHYTMVKTSHFPWYVLKGNWGWKCNGVMPLWCQPFTYIMPCYSHCMNWYLAECCGCSFNWEIFWHIRVIDILSISCGTAIRWMPQDCMDFMLILVQAMA